MNARIPLALVISFLEQQVTQAEVGTLSTLYTCLERTLVASKPWSQSSPGLSPSLPLPCEHAQNASYALPMPYAWLSPSDPQAAPST